MRARIAAVGVVASATMAFAPPVVAHNPPMPSQPHHGTSTDHKHGDHAPMHPRHHGGGHHGQEQQRGSGCPDAGERCALTVRQALSSGALAGI